MNLIIGILALALAVVATLVGVTRIGAWGIERRYPPVGSFVEVGGASIHHVYRPAPEGADLPPVVFIHGASSNLNDQMVPLAPLLKDRAATLFFDRPGYGWSTRGPRTNGTPAAQAQILSGLMDRLAIPRAIVVAHSFGGAAAAAFALAYPEKVAGLVFLSAATHPWPGGATSWYYKVTATPVLGRLFAETIAYPGGRLRMRGASECVFAPNPMPPDYLDRAAIPLVLRPGAFTANAVDVESLYPFAVAEAPRYREISAPTVVVSGDADTVVYEEIHSLGLARDIPGAELVWIRNLGHKPEWIVPDVVLAAIETVSGRPSRLAEVARAAEARIAQDRSGTDCIDVKSGAELTPP